MKLNLRYQKKLKTRQILLQSALDIMGEEKSLDSLFLREVCAKAGIVPAGFYRHFQTMEDLGLSLVDEVGSKLRAILREARSKGAYKTALKNSMEMFFGYVSNNRVLFRFLTREMSGGNKRIRLAIKNEMDFISRELANDLRLPRVTSSQKEFLADFIVSTSFHLAEEFLDCGPKDEPARKKVKIKFLLQLRLIYRGALIRKNKTSRDTNRTRKG